MQKKTAIISGCVVILIILVIVGFWWYKRRKANNGTAYGTGGTTGGTSTSGGTTSSRTETVTGSAGVQILSKVTPSSSTTGTSIMLSQGVAPFILHPDYRWPAQQCTDGNTQGTCTSYGDPSVVTFAWQKRIRVTKIVIVNRTDGLYQDECIGIVVSVDGLDIAKTTAIQPNYTLTLSTDCNKIDIWKPTGNFSMAQFEIWGYEI